MATLQKLTYRFTLDAFKSGNQRILQGWVTGETVVRKLEISLQSGTEPYELPLEGVSASMYVTTPNGTLSINACTVDAENNKVIYEVLSSDIQQTGFTTMQLKLFDNENILISPSFQLEVWESTISDSQAVQSPTYTALTAALAEAEAYAEKAISQVYIDEDYTFVIEMADGTEYTSSALKDCFEDCEAEALKAEGWAVGKQDGEDVTSGSPYYQNNAKYHAGQANGYKNMAENAKNFAYGYANDALGYKNDASGYATTASGFKDEANKWANGTVDGTPVSISDPTYHNNAKYYSEQAQSLGNDEYLKAKSYAVGGTGTRAGEDTDNAKYYKEVCETIVGGGYAASDVTYVNTVSGLTADDVQEALDEIVGDINALGADDIAYDNTDSGLIATDVQDAIDELAGGLGNKADKVSGATNGNFAGLDASGNLTDSGKKASDFATDDEMIAVVNVYGSKNLNSYPYYDTTKSANGLTLTDNGDGSVTISAGTASAKTSFILHSRNSDINKLNLAEGFPVILSGCPIGGSGSSFYLELAGTVNGSAYVYGIDTGDGLTATPLNSDKVSVGIYIESGTVISEPITFRPMIRDARIKDDTYVPYAMTNRELMDSLSGIRFKIYSATIPSDYSVNDWTAIADISDLSGLANWSYVFVLNYNISTSGTRKDLDPNDTVSMIKIDVGVIYMAFKNASLQGKTIRFMVAYK